MGSRCGRRGTSLPLMHFLQAQSPPAALVTAPQVYPKKGLGWHQGWARAFQGVLKNQAASAGDLREAVSIPGLGSSPGGEHSNPLQSSCLGYPKDRGAWQSPVHRVAKESDTTAASGLTGMDKENHCLDSPCCPLPHLWHPVCICDLSQASFHLQRAPHPGSYPSQGGPRLMTNDDNTNVRPICPQNRRVLRGRFLSRWPQVASFPLALMPKTQTPCTLSSV